MTAMEISAKVMALAIRNSGRKGWGKDQVGQATTLLRDSLKANEIEVDAFADAQTRISGNHSAMAQTLEEWGLIERDRGKRGKPAIVVEIEKVMAKLDEEEKAKLDKAKAGEQKDMADGDKDKGKGDGEKSKRQDLGEQKPLVPAK